MEQVVMFKTTDGAYCSTIEEAQRHERLFRVRTLMTSVTGSSYFYAEQIVDQFQQIAAIVEGAIP